MKIKFNVFSKFKILPAIFFGICTIAIDGAIIGASGRECSDIIQECVNKSKEKNHPELDPCEAWRGVKSITTGPNAHTNDPLVACYAFFARNSGGPANWPWVCGTTCLDLKPGIGCDGGCPHIR